MIFTPEKLIQVNNKLAEANQILIVAHKSPDGDAVGSALGLYHYLRNRNFSVWVCLPDPAPSFLGWMEGFEDILNLEQQNKEVSRAIERADLIFCLDFNALHRTGKQMEELLIQSKAFKVMVDHHLDPSDEFDVTFSQTSACSTAQMVYDFIDANGDADMVTPIIGEPLYCGIMTDSGSFRFPSVTPRTHYILSKLLEKGVRNYKVHESVYDTNTIERLRLRGYAINEKLELLTEYNTALLFLTEEELEQFNYVSGDTEGLVNVGLSIQGITRSIFLKESHGLIKISFRSKGLDNPINTFASTYFSGGGHANAAGGKWEGSMEEAVKRVKEALPVFIEENTK